MRCPMKIIVMKCSINGTWYKDKIGKTYNVCSSNDKSYTIIDKNSTRRIVKADCEVIEK